MRSAEHKTLAARRLGLVVALLLSTQLGGCAALRDFWSSLFASDSKTTVRADNASSRAPATSTGSTSKAGAPTVTPTGTSVAVPQAATPPAEAPPRAIAASTQRAWDEALRLMRAGRHEEAERALRELVRTEPDLGGVHANLALLLKRQGRHAEAVESLEQAVKASPRQSVFHNHLGVAYREAGRFEKARSAYERAIELDAGYAAPVLNLGILHDLYLGDAARALEMYTRYLVMTPSGDAGVTKWVAELKNRKGAPHTAQVGAAVRQEKP